MFHNIIGVSWSFAQCNRTRLGVDCSNSFLGCCESPFLRTALGMEMCHCSAATKPLVYPCPIAHHIVVVVSTTLTRSYPSVLTAFKLLCHRYLGSFFKGVFLKQTWD